MARRKNDAAVHRIHRLMDEVYREMFRLEAGASGAEMGLALALLRAWVAADIHLEQCKEWKWLSSVCPLGLKLIEESLSHGCCGRAVTQYGRSR
jgi:hypothetical protein